MGGNVANGSPIGDGPPVLMALGAAIVLRRGEHTRTLPLDEFYLDYMKNRLEPGEFVQGIGVPLPHVGQQVRAYKVSKRYDCDISALCAGLSITLDGDVVRDVRFAFGGMAATVKRAAGAEAAVLGKPWNEAAARAAMAALANDFTPLTDLRASAAYRRQVAAGLLKRLWLETRPVAPLTAREASVWASA
jgi:xanthine dehydrogenase small subunit